MQISSVTTSQMVPTARTATSAVSQVPTDQAVLNYSADSFSKLVSAAKQMPEVRSEVVEAYKSRIQSTHYPAQEIVAGLTKLIGASVVKLADAESSN